MRGLLYEYKMTIMTNFSNWKVVSAKFQEVALFGVSRLLIKSWHIASKKSKNSGFDFLLLSSDIVDLI